MFVWPSVLSKQAPPISSENTWPTVAQSFNPFLYWRMGDAAGTGTLLEDSTANDRDGTLAESYIKEQPAIINAGGDGCVTFNDGYAFYDSTGDIAWQQLISFSFVMLVRFDSIQGVQTLAQLGPNQNDASNYGWILRKNIFDELVFIVSDNTYANSVISDITVSAGVVYQVVVAFDGSQATLAINDTVKVNNLGLPGFTNHDSGDLYIGANYNDGSPLEYSSTTVEEVVYYINALTPLQILTLYESLNYVPPLYFSFDPSKSPTDTSVGQVIDSSTFRLPLREDSHAIETMGVLPIPFPQVYMEFKIEESPGSDPLTFTPFTLLAGLTSHKFSNNYFRQVLSNNDLDFTDFDDVEAYLEAPTSQLDYNVMLVSLLHAQANSVSFPGDIDNSSSVGSTALIDMSVGSTIMLAFDLIAGTIQIGANGVWRHTITQPSKNSDDITLGLSPFFTATNLEHPEEIRDSSLFATLKWAASNNSLEDDNVSLDVTIYGSEKPFNYSVPLGYNEPWPAIQDTGVIDFTTYSVNDPITDWYSTFQTTVSDVYISNFNSEDVLAWELTNISTPRGLLHKGLFDVTDVELESTLYLQHYTGTGFRAHTCVIARASSYSDVNPKQGYLLRIANNPDEFQIVYLSDGNTADEILASFSLAGRVESSKYWNYKFRLNGYTLQGKIWEDGLIEPGEWQVETTDSRYTIGGCGLYANQRLGGDYCKRFSWNRTGYVSVKEGNTTQTNGAAGEQLDSYEPSVGGNLGAVVYNKINDQYVIAQIQNENSTHVMRVLDSTIGDITVVDTYNFSEDYGIFRQFIYNENTGITYAVYSETPDYEVKTVDFDNETTAQVDTLPSGYFGLAYDSSRDKWYTYNSTDVWGIDPVAWTLTNEVATGLDLTSFNSPNYDPYHDEFIAGGPGNADLARYSPIDFSYLGTIHTSGSNPTGLGLDIRRNQYYVADAGTVADLRRYRAVPYDWEITSDIIQLEHPREFIFSTLNNATLTVRHVSLPWERYLRPEFLVFTFNAVDNTGTLNVEITAKNGSNIIGTVNQTINTNGISTVFMACTFGGINNTWDFRDFEFTFTGQSGSPTISMTEIQVDRLNYETPDYFTFDENAAPTNTSYGQVIDESTIRIPGATMGDSNVGVLFKTKGPLPDTWDRVYAEVEVNVTNGFPAPSWSDGLDVYLIWSNTDFFDNSYFDTNQAGASLPSNLDNGTFYEPPISSATLGVVGVGIGQFTINSNPPGVDDRLGTSGTEQIDYGRGRTIMCGIDFIDHTINVGSNGTWRQTLTGQPFFLVDSNDRNNNDHAFEDVYTYEGYRDGGPYHLYILVKQENTRQDPLTSFDITLKGGLVPFDHEPLSYFNKDRMEYINVNTTYDFSNLTSGVAPTGWTSEWDTSGLTVTVEDTPYSLGEKSIQLTNTIDGRKAVKLDSFGDQSDCEILVKVSHLEDLDGTASRVILRGSGSAGTESGYIAQIREDGANSQYEISKFVNGTFTEIAHVDKDWGVKTLYWVRFQAIGSNIRMKLWVDQTAEPDNWGIEITDSDLTSGWVGIGTSKPNVVEFDWFSTSLGSNTAPSPY